MVVLGAIIEKVSGLNYFDYIRQHIYKPAAMNQTDRFDLNDHPANVAEGYIPQEDGTYQNNNNTKGILPSPAGGGYSNVRDLHKFALALSSGKLVSSSSKNKLFTDHMGMDYGYGFQVQSFEGGKIVGHSGKAPGVNAVLYILQEKEYIVAVMSNYHSSVEWLSEYILHLMRNEDGLKE